MRHALALVKDSAELQVLQGEIDALIARCTERREFMKKQLETMDKAMADEKTAIWDKITDYVKERDLLPPGYDENNGWGLQIDGGAVYAVTRDEVEKPDISQMLGRLFT